MQKLTGSRRGTEQIGVANKEDTYERRPTLQHHNTDGVKLKKDSWNVTVDEFGMHDKGQRCDGEPNQKGKDSGNSTPRLMIRPQLQKWQIQCNETRDVSGFSKAAFNRDSCADQLHHVVQGQISLVLTLRVISREMQSWGGCKDISMQS